MLIVSNVRMDRAVTERAIERAEARGCGLVVLVVLDRAIPAKVASQFMDAGQIGARPSDGFLESLYHRHEELAMLRADEVVAEAADRAVAAEIVVRRGDYAREVAAAIDALRPSAVVVERKRSLVRFATGDAFLAKLERDVGFDLVEV
jgi:hypothetical protein